MREDSILLETSRDQIPALLAHLDHFIIMDDVEVADVADQTAGFTVAGPQAAAILGNAGLPTDSLSPFRSQLAIWQESAVTLLLGYSPLVPRFEVWANPAVIGQIGAALIGADALPVSTKAIDTRLRVLEGTPRYGIDIRNTASAHDLPQETGQTRALHFSKGCYLGQEIVERIRSRGNVHRTFSGFSLTGSLPEPGAVLTADAKPVGELTSIAAIPLPASSSQAAHTVQLALGYIRREALPVTAQARNLPIEYPGGIATPIALPYPIP
jgi:aminomethyltransferase